MKKNDEAEITHSAPDAPDATQAVEPEPLAEPINNDPHRDFPRPLGTDVNEPPAEPTPEDPKEEKRVPPNWQPMEVHGASGTTTWLLPDGQSEQWINGQFASRSEPIRSGP